MELVPEVKKYLTAADIFETDDRQTEDIYIPEWKGWITLRVLSAAEAIQFQTSLENATDKRSAWVRIFALCAVNQDGTPMFPNKIHVDQLFKKNAGVFLKLQKKLLEFNGFKQTVEELNEAKNA
jgi:hypothetical protein